MRTSDAVSFLGPESSDVITIGFHPDVQDTEVLLHGELPAGAMDLARGDLGLAMTLLPRPGEYVVTVVLHVSAELQPWRPRLREPPAFKRALGHPQQNGDLGLGQERGLDLDACMSFHA